MLILGLDGKKILQKHVIVKGKSVLYFLAVYIGPYETKYKWIHQSRIMSCGDFMMQYDSMNNCNEKIADLKNMNASKFKDARCGILSLSVR